MGRIATRLVLFGWSIASCLAATPQLINYQGRLINGTNLVNGPVGLTLRIYTNATAGTYLFEDSNTVTVVDGLYSTMLGANPKSGTLTNALASGSAWIQVMINGAALSPREPIAAAAYALAGAGGSGNYVLKTGDTMTGMLTLSNNPLNIVNMVDRGDGLMQLISIVGGQSVEIGSNANGYMYGAAVGYAADAYYDGAAVGDQANGAWYGVAMGPAANGAYHGVAFSEGAYAAGTNIAIGFNAWAEGSERIAIGHDVVVPRDNAAAIRGTLFLDGGSNVYYRETFGSGTWKALALATSAPVYVEIDPLWTTASNGMQSQINAKANSNLVWSTFAKSSDVTNCVKKTGDTMTGVLCINVGAGNDLTITNTGTSVQIGNAANGNDLGTAVGCQARGSNWGAAVGYNSKAYSSGAAVGKDANGSSLGAALGYDAESEDSGAAVGYNANGAHSGAAVGYNANGAGAGGIDGGAAIGYMANAYAEGVAAGYTANANINGVAVGYEADGTNFGAAVGYQSRGWDSGAALGMGANGSFEAVGVGHLANGYYAGVGIGHEAEAVYHGVAVGEYAKAITNGVAVGSQANGIDDGTAVGRNAEGMSDGAALGSQARGSTSGVAVGDEANGINHGVAVGEMARGYNYGMAVGNGANGVNSNVAVGAGANAGGGSRRIAIGLNVNNDADDSARIRGTLYLDGGTGVLIRSTFGSGSWSAKAFTIDHPLDPQNKVLRHFCVEGPVVWNVYKGTARLNGMGAATVKLPDYFEALNKNPQYDLTPVGSPMPNLFVKQTVQDNRFVIGGGVAGGDVCWTVTGERNDAACIEDLKLRPVEQLKSELKSGQAAAENATVNADASAR